MPITKQQLGQEERKQIWYASFLMCNILTCMVWRCLSVDNFG